MSNRIESDYFVWMYDMMCNGIEDRSYFELFNYLNMVEFVPIIPMDENRAEDGRNLRYRYAYEANLASHDILEAFGGKPCSVLEMMIALSIRCEEAIMQNSDYGDRTSEWFWEMMKSLGLLYMDDSCFNMSEVGHILYIFMNRLYKKNGQGGLFTIHDPRKDMRKHEIWYQMCFYLDELVGV